MRSGQGWNKVIRFDSMDQKPIHKLPPTKRAEYQVCSFANTYIDIFNTQPLSVRLASLAKLYGMASCLVIAAFAASVRKLPYVEPTQLTAERQGVRLPLFWLTDNRPKEPEE